MLHCCLAALAWQTPSAQLHWPEAANLQPALASQPVAGAAGVTAGATGLAAQSHVWPQMMVVWGADMLVRKLRRLGVSGEGLEWAGGEGEVVGKERDGGRRRGWALSRV